MTILSDYKQKHTELLKNLKEYRHATSQLYIRSNDELGGSEDLVYRFYHHSFKVYRAQAATEEIVKLLTLMAPKGAKLDKWFMEIVKDGTGHVWKLEHNQEWPQHTRPILEAYFHSVYFLKQVVHYGQKLRKPPNMLPTGWAALLELYGIR